MNIQNGIEETNFKYKVNEACIYRFDTIRTYIKYNILFSVLIIKFIELLQSRRVHETNSTLILNTNLPSARTN